MDIGLLSLLIGLAAGAFGYWFTTFNMQPILKFREIRDQILMDFIYYAQVINADNLNDEMKSLHRERILANRRTSSQLRAIIQDLPKWYLTYLKFKGYQPEEAARYLIGFSNSTEYLQASKAEAAVRKKLGLPKET